MNRSEIIVILEVKFSHGLTIEITFFDSIFLFPGLLSSYECDAHFYEISFAVDLHRNDRCAHFFDFGFESDDLIFIQEEFSFSFWIELSHASLIFSDVNTSGKWSSTSNKDIGALQVNTSISDTFYLFSEELYTCFVLFDDLIVEMSLSIFGVDM